MTESPTRPPDDETLRVQLGILNARGNYYGNRAWQVPLAYAAIVSSVDALDGSTSSWAWWLLATLGGVTALLVCAANAALCRAVDRIREVESALRLPRTARNRKWIDRALLAFVGVATAFCVARALNLIGGS